MAAKPLAALLMAIVPGASLLAVEPPRVYRNVTRPPCITGIPISRYQYGARSPSEIEISRTAVLVRRSTRVSEVMEQPPRVVVRSEYADESFRGPAGPFGGMNLQRRIDHSVQSEGYLPPAVWEGLRNGPQRNPQYEQSGRGLSNVDLDRGVTQRTLRDSFTAVMPSPPPRRQTVIDLYQLDRAGIRINHCEISDVAIQLYDDGQWVLSLRADQNRRPEDGGLEGYNPHLHIRRNEFFIRMRCLGAFDHPPMRDVPTTGKPVLVDLDPYSFWVENGEPRYIRRHGFDPLVHEHFQDIDRVEIEFYYR